MALPPQFTSRVNSSVVARAPRRVASSGLAEGLGLLGRTAAVAADRDRQVDEAEADSQFRIAQEEQRRDRSRRAMEFGGQLAEARIEYARRTQEARSETEPGAPGWEARAAEIRAEVFAPLQSLYADDEELAERLAPQLQNVAASIAADEMAWELQQRTAWEGERFRTTLQAEADALLTDPDPAKMGEALERVETLIDLSDYDGTTKGKLRLLARRTLAGGTLDGLALAEDYDALGAVLESGTLDGVLGDDKDNYLRTVTAGRAAQAREAEIAASAARDQARDALALLKVQIEAGEDVTQSTIRQALALAQAADVPADELATFAYLGEESVNARQFRRMDDGGLQREIAALQALESAGRLDAAGQRRLEHAEAAMGQRDGAAGESLSTLWKSGPEGQAQAVAQLAEMPTDRAWAAASRAGNTRMAIYARLRPDGRREAIEGRALREARPDDFLPPKTAAGGNAKEQARRAFRAYIGEDLVRQLGGGFDEVFEASLDVMAGTAGEWSESGLRGAVRAVFGASMRPGSPGVVQGGIGAVRGRMVELPADMTAAEFDRYLSRVDFSDARYSNDQPASKADVLRSYLPVPISEPGADGVTRYVFVDAQGAPLMRADRVTRFIIPVKR